jgi:hypothetical protein
MDQIRLNGISQRKFLDLCVNKLDSVSLRGLLDYGFGVKYDALKSYYSGRRLLPREFFDNLMFLCKLEGIDFEIIAGNWGQAKGGKNSKRKPLKTQKGF